ncbi:MAG: STAS domain-containing protein [Isosphaeraceae bacterium]
MPDIRNQKSWEQAPSAPGAVSRTEGVYQFPATLRDANHRPDFSIRAVGRLTVVDFVNAEVLFEEAAVEELGARLQSLVAEGHVRLLLNLSSVRYASSSVVALVAWLYRRVELAGGFLRLYGLDPVLFDALRICRLDGVVEVYADEAAAALGKRQATSD